MTPNLWKQKILALISYRLVIVSPITQNTDADTMRNVKILDMEMGNAWHRMSRKNRASAVVINRPK